MKTNQVMIRENVEQRTSDYYFNATITLKSWNIENPTNMKSISEFQKNKGTKEFIKHLQENEGIEKPIITSNKGTWMHPLIYIDFCMWISVEFKTIALKYVLDGLIQNRHAAGDYYNEMCAAIMETWVEIHGIKPNAMIYINEAILIKKIAGINKERNEMTEKELDKITILQKVNSTLIKKRIGKESRIKHLEITSESI